jgi:hypothetical protein
MSYYLINAPVLSHCHYKCRKWAVLSVIITMSLFLEIADFSIDLC